MLEPRETPQGGWERFWKPAFEEAGELTEDGRPTLEAIQNELSDYSFMLEQVPKVYSDLTGYQISKPNTYAFEVIAQAEEFFDKIIREDIADELTGLTYDEIQEWIEENQHA